MLDGDHSETLVRLVQESIDRGTPLNITGGGSKHFYGYPVAEGVTRLDMTTHRGVIDYAPEELMIRVRAGTPLAEINNLLAENNQILGFEPPDFDHCATIGGSVASGLSGPRRPYAGAIRDFVLGITMITGEGHIVSFGGQVMKNVAGYDVSRLIVGAMGTLGVILDVSLKVLPAPEVEKSIATSMTIGELQKSIRRLNNTAVLSASSFEKGMCYLRFSGSALAVDAAISRYEGKCIGNDYWRQHIRLNDFSPRHRLWRVSVLPTSTLFLDRAVRVEWGGGLRWILDEDDLSGSGEPSDLRHQANEVDGHVTLFECSAQAMKKTTRIFHPLPKILSDIHQRLKLKFDPAGIFNPGRMYR